MRTDVFQLTFNNPTLTGPEQLAHIERSLRSARRIALQLEEAPSTGTRHHQCMFETTNPRLSSKIIRLFPGAHVTPCKGRNRVFDTWNYCTKAGRIEGPWTIGDAPISKAAKTAKNFAERNALILSRPLFESVDDGTVDIKSYKHLKQAIELYRLEKAESYSHHDVRGHWYWGPPGSGKSRTARERYPGAYLKAQNKWWDGYLLQRSVILDDLDTPTLGHYLKIWADRYACTGETKGGTTPLAHHAFIVTSNYSIDDLFTDSEIRAAIKRRFTVTRFELI